MLITRSYRRSGRAVPEMANLVINNPTVGRVTHSHNFSSGPSSLDPLPAKVVVGLLIAIGVGVIAGAAWLWPSREHVDIPLPYQSASGGAVTTVSGHVLSSGLGDCGSPSAGQVLTTAPLPATGGAGRCVLARVAIDSGPNAGASTLLEFSPGPGQPQLAAGDHIRVIRGIGLEQRGLFRQQSVEVSLLSGGAGGGTVGRGGAGLLHDHGLDIAAVLLHAGELLGGRIELGVEAGEHVDV